MDLNTYWTSRPARRVRFGATNIAFDCSTRMADFRARTALTKEPKTIEWLQRLGPEAVLYDVGANVGIYAVFAAAVVGATVYAFEPSGSNFALLCSNIELNGLSGRVLPYCLGLAERSRVTVLHVVGGHGGESGNSVAMAVDHRLAPRTFPMQQGIVAMRGDEFAEAAGIRRPTALKVDVDGLEHLVMDGFRDVVRDERLTTINIELLPSLEQHAGVIQDLIAAGFVVDEELSFTHRSGSNRNIVFTRG